MTVCCKNWGRARKAEAAVGLTEGREVAPPDVSNSLRATPIFKAAIGERAQNGPLGPQINASINAMAEMRLQFVRNLTQTLPFPQERVGEYFRGWNNALEMIVAAIDSQRTE